MLLLVYANILNIHNRLYIQYYKVLYYIVYSFYVTKNIITSKRQESQIKVLFSTLPASVIFLIIYFLSHISYHNLLIAYNYVIMLLFLDLL